MSATARFARTSISDLDDMYLDWVRSALDNDAAFRTFRQLPGIKNTVDGVKAAHGVIYRDVALNQTPGLWDYLEQFRTSDSVGGPDTVAYPEGLMSPTTWRYIKVLSDLQALFGPLDGWRIVEIGVGYGGQCKIICDVHEVASYTMYDLEPVSRLARKYLESVGSPVITRLTCADFRCLREDDLGPYDLVISNWALSECARDIQDQYIERVLRRSKRGYITYNQISQLFDVDSYRVSEFVERLGLPVEIRHEELSKGTHPEPWQSFVLHWGQRQG